MFSKFMKNVLSFFSKNNGPTPLPKFSYSVQNYPNSFDSGLPNIGNGVAADFNRDGKIDIVYSVDIMGADKTYATPVGIFTNTGKGFTPYKITIDGNKNQWPDVKFGMYTATYDINGDKIPDIIPIDQSEVKGTKGYFEGNYQYAYISSGVGKYNKVQIGEDKFNVHGWGIIESADNKFRILYNTPWTENRLGDDGVKTVISTYDRTTKKFTAEKFNGNDYFYKWMPDSYKEFFYQTTVDINNDGNTDIVGFTSTSGKNAVFLNNGHGSFKFSKEIDTGLSSNVRVEETTSGDFNGDGFKDLAIMGVNHNEGYNKTLRILINKNGKTFEDKTEQYLKGEFQNIKSSYGYLDSYDVNSDGLTDFTWNHNTSNNHDENWNFDVFTSKGNEFSINTLENVVDPRTIPLGNNKLYDGKKIITLNDTSYNKQKVKVAPTWLPGEFDDYVITKDKGFNIFTSDTDQYWVSNTKRNINFDDYAIMLNTNAKLIGQPIPIPSDWG